MQEELDQPGEWFLDTASGRLYYMPPAGVDPNTLTIVAPFLNRIVNAQGDVNAGTHVEHVHFEGLEFRHTTFTLGHIEARVHTDTAIMFENTNDSSVRNCHFENIGGYALWLHLDSQRNIFDRNTVLHSGGGGVLLTGARLSYMDDTKVYTPGRGRREGRPDPQRDHPQHRRALRQDPLLRRRGAPGLASRSACRWRRATTSPTTISTTSRATASSPSATRAATWWNTTTSTTAMQTTIDGACIHFATMNHLNAPNFILNNWLYDIWGYEQKPDGNPVRTTLPTASSSTGTPATPP